MIKPFIAQDLREVSPLVLAYIGDSIYELYARCKSATLGAGSNNKMHNNTVHYVSAEAQANSIRILQDELTEKETDYFRRGKNSNPHAVSKMRTMLTTCTQQDLKPFWDISSSITKSPGWNI